MLSDLIIQEIGGSPKIARRNYGGWQSWTGGSLAEDESDDEEKEESEEELEKESICRRDLRRMLSEIISEIINEKQMMSYNPTPSGGYEQTGTPRPIVQGRVVGPQNEEEAIQKFMRIENMSDGDYSITCTKGAGKSWSCVANSSELGRENILEES